GTWHFELRPVCDIRLRLDSDGGGEVKGLIARVGQLVVVLGLLDRTDALADRGIAEPAPDVALDGVRVETLLAHAREPNPHGDLALSEAGNLQARREVGRRVVDRVLNVVARNLDLEADTILG